MKTSLGGWAQRECSSTFCCPTRIRELVFQHFLLLKAQLQPKISKACVKQKTGEFNRIYSVICLTPPSSGERRAMGDKGAAGSPGNLWLMSPYGWWYKCKEKCVCDLFVSRIDGGHEWSDERAAKEWKLWTRPTSKTSWAVNEELSDWKKSATHWCHHIC